MHNESITSSKLHHRINPKQIFQNLLHLEVCFSAYLTRYMSLFFYICIENVNVCLYLYHRIGLKIHFWIRNPNHFRPVFGDEKIFKVLAKIKITRETI